MNRRAFLLGSAAALVVKAHPLGGVDAVEVVTVPRLSLEEFMQAYMETTMQAWQRNVARWLEEEFLHGPGVGQPLGILKYAHKTRSQSKSVVPAFWITEFNPDTEESWVKSRFFDQYQQEWPDEGAEL